MKPRRIAADQATPRSPAIPNPVELTCSVDLQHPSANSEAWLLPNGRRLTLISLQARQPTVIYTSYYRSTTVSCLLPEKSRFLSFFLSFFFFFMCTGLNKILWQVSRACQLHGANSEGRRRISLRIHCSWRKTFRN